MSQETTERLSQTMIEYHTLCKNLLVELKTEFKTVDENKLVKKVAGLEKFGSSIIKRNLLSDAKKQSKFEKFTKIIIEMEAKECEEGNKLNRDALVTDQQLKSEWQNVEEKLDKLSGAVTSRLENQLQIKRLKVEKEDVDTMLQTIQSHQSFFDTLKSKFENFSTQINQTFQINNSVSL